MSGLPVVVHDPAVRQHHAGLVGEVQQGLLAPMAVAVTGIVVEPFRIGAAACEDGAGELAL